MARYIGACWIAAGVLLAGCATTSEMQIHLAAANLDRAQPTVKFYRLTIKGHSTNVKSTLETGYYDAGALRALYGQVGQGAAQGTTDRSVGAQLFRYDDKNKTWQSLPPNELFTIIYGADAGALAKTVEAYGKSQKVGESLGRLLARSAGDEQSRDAETAEQTQADLGKAATALAARAKEAGQNLKAAAEGDDTTARTPAKVDALMLRLAQEALAQLNSSTKLEPDDPETSYTRLQEVYDVLRQNPPK